MIDYFRRHLDAKLFLPYLGIIVIGVVVLILASQFILPASFNRHMSGVEADRLDRCQFAHRSTWRTHLGGVSR